MSIYPQQLKNVYGVIVAVIYKDRVDFKPESPVKDSVASSGIFIPKEKSPEFGDRSIIYLKDQLFSKAFCEI